MIDNAGDIIGQYSSTFTFAQIFRELGEILVPTVNVVALLVIVISAMGMIWSQSEQQAAIARRALIASLVGIALVWVTDTLVGAFSASQANEVGDVNDLMVALGDRLTLELEGVAGYLRIIAIVVAVFMIILNGIRAILAFGNEEGQGHLRRAIFATLIAIPLMAVGDEIASTVTRGGQASGLVAVLIAIADAFLKLLGLAAVAVIVIAAILMIANVGRDEQYQRAKDLLIRVAIGFVIIAVSWAFLQFLVGAVGGN